MSVVALDVSTNLFDVYTGAVDIFEHVIAVFDVTDEVVANLPADSLLIKVFQIRWINTGNFNVGESTIEDANSPEDHADLRCHVLDGVLEQREGGLECDGC